MAQKRVLPVLFDGKHEIGQWTTDGNAVLINAGDAALRLSDHGYTSEQVVKGYREILKNLDEKKLVYV